MKRPSRRGRRPRRRASDSSLLQLISSRETPNSAVAAAAREQEQIAMLEQRAIEQVRRLSQLSNAAACLSMLVDWIDRFATRQERRSI